MPRTTWILLLSLCAWGPGIWRAGFALDDREVLFSNPVVEGRVPWREVLIRDYWSHHPAGAAGHYRPLAVASLRLDRALWGAAPAGYHATNLLLHLAVVALAGALLATLARRSDAPWPWFGLALFAVHPALADSVAWISGRTSMLSALGGLAGACLVARLAARRSAAGVACASAAATVLALGAKEDGVVFALLVVGVALASGRRSSALAAAAGAVAGLLAYSALRAAALGEWLPSAPRAPLAGAALGERLQVSGAAAAEALRVAAVPVGYPPAWAAEELAARGPAVAALAWAALLAALGAGTWAAVTARGERRLAGASAALAACAVLPWMQLVPAGEVLAPRFLYLPLLAAAPFVHRLWCAAWSPARAAPAATLALALGVVLAWQRTGVYASRSSYWEAQRVAGGDTAQAWNALGNARLEAGDRDGARAAFERALELDPGYSRPLSNLALVAAEGGALAEAEELLRRAVAAGPENAVAWANLGSVLLRRDRPREAVAAYERAVAVSPGAAGLWRGLGRARHRAGDAAGALAAVREALRLDPGDASAARLWRALGE